MASPKHHRKLIQPSTNTTADFCMFQCGPQLAHTGFCLPECIIFCPSLCRSTGPSQSPANSPYALPQPPDHHHHRPPLSLPLKISVVLITATLFYTLYKLFQRWRRRTPSPENQENYDDHDLNDVVDHPIWYIRTTGLQPSVINAIKVVKYVKNDKVVDGSDCLVCLSEFEENDMVRLLPYCKHAFHISCIDTWLRSHTNCPLCRAGIVSNNVVSTDVMVEEIELRDYNEAGESSEVRVGETDEDENSNYSIDVDGDLGIELVKIKLPNKSDNTSPKREAG